MIRWIIDGQLGTAPYADNLRAIATIIDVRELADRSGNDPQALRLKVEEGIAALHRGDRVVVACDFGISRSNAIAAGILAKWQKQSLDWAVEETVARTQEPSIKLDVIGALRRAMFEAPASTDPGCILVTGATGFLGENLLAGLSNKLEVFAPGRSDINLLGAATQLERFCRDRRIGQILHLAHPRFFTTNEAMGQSLTMLKNLIDVCRVLEIRLILPSSRAVFSGYRSSGELLGPDAVLHPKGVYGETKYLQEILVCTAVGNDEIEATIVRVAPTYGPGGERPRLIRRFYQLLIEGKPIVTHMYEASTPARLDLLYIDDTVSGLEKILYDRETRVHHLSPGLAYSPRDIAERLAVILGKTPEFGEMQIDDYASNIFLDSSESQKLLHWEPLVQIDEGLRRTLAAFG
jgi:nucleoside-diphosphate-sugar epimerase